MLSRHADSCYWIGRYVERAEATARMVDVHYHAALESGRRPRRRDRARRRDDQPDALEASLLTISGSAGRLLPTLPETENDRDVMQFFGFDAENPNSILSVWKSARDNARTIREQIASEMWENAEYFLS